MFIIRRSRWSVQLTGITTHTLSTLSSVSSQTNQRSKCHGVGYADKDRVRDRDRDRDHFIDFQKNGTPISEKEKKIKKRAPPGPFEFEDLTAKTPVHSDLPFAFRYSYTEVPKSDPVGFQEKFSPFGPNRLDRVWDGQQAVPNSSSSSSSHMVSVSSSWSSSRTSPVADPFSPKIRESKYSLKGIKFVNPPSPIATRGHPRKERTREEILGEPLTKEEIKELVERSIKSRRQLNIGRDGLTHNTLIEIHDHWKRECVVRVRCKGVPTLDMENVIFQIEDKTGGKIIERAGGTLYLFRGRNYIYKERPVIPPMLWKPHSPIYPKLITEAPGGLKVHVANFLRKRGLRIMPLCKLAKNGYYGDLVGHVREAFEDDVLVRIDCTGLNTSDYKRIGGKLRDLVPCVLLSFDKEQIIVWNGEYRKLDSGPTHWFKSEKVGDGTAFRNADITPGDVNSTSRNAGLASGNVKPDGRETCRDVNCIGYSAVDLEELCDVCEDFEALDEDDSDYTSDV